jgi:hypothetical protein
MAWHFFTALLGCISHLAKPVVHIAQVLVALFYGCITLASRTLHINSFYWNDYSVLLCFWFVKAGPPVFVLLMLGPQSWQ